MVSVSDYWYIAKVSQTAQQTIAREMNAANEQCDSAITLPASRITVHCYHAASLILSRCPRMCLLCCTLGATRAFPPHHPLIPVDYQLTGQPVLIGGTVRLHAGAHTRTSDT